MGKSNTFVMGTSHNFGSNLDGMEPRDARIAGQKIKAAREAKKWSQADLGREVGISQPAIKKIEDGDTQQSRYLAQVALKVGLDPAELDPDLRGVKPNGGNALSERELFADRQSDFPIHAAAEGGPGEIIVGSDPVDWHPRPQRLANVRDAYGLYIIGESMAPEYRPGDIALVNPTLPQVGGEVYIFYAEREGEARATIKHLRRATGDKWLVSQHNKQKDFELSRKEWQWAHRVIGKYNRQ
jgi:phage repressor protein C with HTH and peptisase S24 domain